MKYALFFLFFFLSISVLIRAQREYFIQKENSDSVFSGQLRFINSLRPVPPLTADELSMLNKGYSVVRMDTVMVSRYWLLRRRVVKVDSFFLEQHMLDPVLTTAMASRQFSIGSFILAWQKLVTPGIILLLFLLLRAYGKKNDDAEAPS